mgnify:FL=1
MKIEGGIYMTKLTHFNEQGRAKMVDVSQKDDIIRTAIATSSVTVNKIIYDEIVSGTNKKDMYLLLPK